jgi:hypothetical protein
LGTLDENKRPCLALNFLRKNLNENDYIVDLYGDGPLKDKLLLEFNNSNIIFHGTKAIEDIFLNSYDFIILSSKYEASPNNLREAFAYSVPALIASDIKGGVKEFSVTTSIFLDFSKSFNGDFFTFLKSKLFHESDFKENCGNNYDFNSEIRNLINE